MLLRAARVTARLPAPGLPVLRASALARHVLRPPLSSYRMLCLVAEPGKEPGPANSDAERTFPKWALGNDATPTHDTAEIEKLLEARGQAQDVKDYVTAEALVVQIQAMDVIIDQRLKKYFCVPPEIGAKLRERYTARRAKD